MSSHIQLIDTPIADDETLRALHEFYLAIDGELFPDDPPVPLEERLVGWRHLLETEAIPRWAVWKGPEVVASSGVFIDLEQNLANAGGWVYVHRQHRGSGLGREVAAPMLDFVQENSRTRFATGINEGWPEEALVKRAGMKLAYRERLSRLSFQDLDWDLMESWVARATERASDYEILLLRSPIPEEHLQAFCDLVFVMNSAPLENYEEEDEVMTPESWRDVEAKARLREQDILINIARHKPSGDFAGYTNVSFHRLQPDLVEQWDTGVDPKHRNKGLGRWVKASMALELRDEYPDVRRIDTENNDYNEPMLNINVEMGFKPVLIRNIWQGDVATLRKNLSV
ncbi:MAG: hypothetical protein ACRDX9_03735 [Acidimicrobiia bacterium]